MADFADMISDTLGLQAHHVGWVRGPRWMGIPGYITHAAKGVGVELISLEVKRNIFMMEASYAVRGPEYKVNSFKAKVKAALTHFGALEQR